MANKIINVGKLKELVSDYVTVKSEYDDSLCLTYNDLTTPTIIEKDYDIVEIFQYSVGDGGTMYANNQLVCEIDVRVNESKLISGYSYEITNVLYTKNVAAEATSSTISFDGNIYTVYRDGRKELSSTVPQIRTVTYTENTSTANTKSNTGTCTWETESFDWEIIQGVADKKLIGYNYEITNIDYVNSVSYNTTSSTISFDGEKWALYENADTELIATYPQTRNVIYTENTSTANTKSNTGTCTWETESFDWEIIQGIAGKIPSGFKYYIVNINYDNIVDYNVTSETITFDGEKWQEYENADPELISTEKNITRTVTFTENKSTTDNKINTGTCTWETESFDWEITQTPMTHSIIFYYPGFTSFDDTTKWNGYSGTSLTSLVGQSVPRTQIEYVWLSDSVTSITENALNNATRLKGLKCGGDNTTTQDGAVIGKSIISIGANAFNGCASLTNVEFSDDTKIQSIGNEAFKNCSKISSFTIPDSVVSFGTNVFSGDTALTYVKFGSGLTEANQSMLSGTSNVNTVHIKSKKVGDFKQTTATTFTSNKISDSYPSAATPSIRTETQVKYSGFNISSVTLDTSVETISDNCFANCTNLKVLNIANDIKATKIGSHAFYLCKTLSSTTIPQNINTIDEYAFFACSASTLMSLPQGIKTIGEGAFYYNNNVSAITIPKTVTEIGKHAFGYCKNNTQLVFEESENALTIGHGAFERNNDMSKTNSGITLPKNTVSIGDCSFAENEYASKIHIQSNEESGTTIGSSAFSHCASATELTIDNYVKSIGEYAFQYCYLLPSYAIPESVTSITRNPWIYCPSISSITVDTNNSVYTSRYGNDACNCIMVKDTTIKLLQAGCYNSTIHEGIDTCNEQSFMGNMFMGAASNFGGKLESGGWIGFRPPISQLTYSNKTLKFPDSLLTIENYAFFDDNYLYTINNSSDVVQLGKNLKTIKNYSFTNTNIYNINLPNTVESIGLSAFFASNGNHIHIPTSLSNCDFGYSSVFCYCSVETIDGGSSRYTVSNNNVYESTVLLLGSSSGATHILTSTTKIAECACHGNNLITTLTIPNNVTEIEYRAYAECYYLNDLTLGTSLATIGEQAFYYDSSLVNVTMPNSLRTIYREAFYYCYGIQNLTLNNGLEIINNYVFYGCSSVKEITIPNSVETIGTYAFHGCSSASALTISTNSNYKSIGDETFSYCSNLTQVTIPSNITSTYYAFYYCTNLTSVTFETTSDLTVRTSSFNSCSKLQTVTFKSTNNLTLEGGAFGYCSALESIYSKAENPSDITSYTFSNVKHNGVLHVPSGKKDAYAQWMQAPNYSSYLGNLEWTIEDDN